MAEIKDFINRWEHGMLIQSPAWVHYTEPFFLIIMFYCGVLNFFFKRDLVNKPGKRVTNEARHPQEVLRDRIVSRLMQNPNELEVLQKRLEDDKMIEYGECK